MITELTMPECERNFQRSTSIVRQRPLSPDDRSELGGGSGRHLGGERLSGVLSADLPRRLVEPRLDAVLPILLEMRILNHVVVFGSHFLKRTRRSSLL